MCTMGPTSDDPYLVVIGYPALDRYHVQEPCLGFPASQIQPGFTSTSTQIPIEGDDSSGFQHPVTYQDSPAAHNTYNNYYYQQQPYRPLVSDEPNHDPSFGRTMLALMIVLISGMCLMSVAMWLIFDAYVPDFALASLKVSNFRATDAKLTGTWKVDMSIRNWNKDLSVHFDNVASSIYYEANLLATSSVHPFQVMQMERRILSFNISADTNAGKFHGQELAGKLQQGMVAFGLRVGMRAVFKKHNGEVHSWENVEIFCGNMEVIFSSPGEGLLVPGSLGSTCLISVHRD